MADNGKTLEERVAYLETEQAALIYNLSGNNGHMKNLLEETSRYLANCDPEAQGLQDKITAALTDICKRPPGCR